MSLAKPYSVGVYETPFPSNTIYKKSQGFFLT